MNRKILYLLGILLTLLVGTYLYWLFCCKSCFSNPKELSTTTLITTTKGLFPFEWHDSSSQMVYSSQDNFDFLLQDHQLLFPIKDSIRQGISQLQSFLNQHPTKGIEIIGHYGDKEVTPNQNLNIGMARAQSIRDFFIDQGIANHQIIISSQKNVELNKMKDTLHGPVSFRLLTLGEPLQTNDMEEAQWIQKLQSSPIRLYSDFNNNQVNLTGDQENTLERIIQYLEKNPDASLQITGHTDNLGDEDINKTLGMQRSLHAKSLMIKRGITADRIITLSAGESQPIADNLTSSGRAQNRRTEITIK